MAKRNDIDRWLYEDIKEHGPQSSWDWEAELRFARFVGDTHAAEWIEKAVDSKAPTGLRCAVVESVYQRVHRQRLEGLRRLKARGIVTASWIGGGAGCWYELGVRRFRLYQLAGPNVEYYNHPTPTDEGCDDGEAKRH